MKNQVNEDKKKACELYSCCWWSVCLSGLPACLSISIYLAGGLSLNGWCLTQARPNISLTSSHSTVVVLLDMPTSWSPPMPVATAVNIAITFTQMDWLQYNTIILYIIITACIYCRLREDWAAGCYIEERKREIEWSLLHVYVPIRLLVIVVVVIIIVDARFIIIFKLKLKLKWERYINYIAKFSTLKSSF